MLIRLSLVVGGLLFCSIANALDEVSPRKIDLSEFAIPTEDIPKGSRQVEAPNDSVLLHTNPQNFAKLCLRLREFIDLKCPKQDTLDEAKAINSDHFLKYEQKRAKIQLLGAKMKTTWETAAVEIAKEIGPCQILLHDCHIESNRYDANLECWTAPVLIRHLKHCAEFSPTRPFQRAIGSRDVAVKQWHVTVYQNPEGTGLEFRIPHAPEDARKLGAIRGTASILFDVVYLQPLITTGSNDNAQVVNFRIGFTVRHIEIFNDNEDNPAISSAIPQPDWKLSYFKPMSQQLQTSKEAIDVRKWSSKDRKTTLQARLFDRNQDSVSLEKPNGQIIDVKLSELSTTDRRYVDRVMPAKDAKAK